MPSKKRLDLILVEKKLAKTRSRARSLIMSGKVMVNQLPVDKPGAQVLFDANIQLKTKDHPYASRGGLKLAAALTANEINCNEAVCMDVGASTGGFTDCLLKNGASKVYSIDVGYGQLAWELRQNPKVVVLERTNIRRLDPQKIAGPVDIVTIDVSFISLKIVIPTILQYIQPGGIILALIKPQFEVGKGKVGKGGVVRDDAIRNQVIDDLSVFFESLGLQCKNVIPSPILGPKGNKEFVILLEKPALNSTTRFS